MKMIDVNSIKFQNESNKLELNVPHQSCTTCDDKSLPFLKFDFQKLEIYLAWGPSAFHVFKDSMTSRSLASFLHVYFCILFLYSL